ncbi:MAG: hypothetical protein FWE95_01635 [Planctomycetaceae bacterium]|nr:hypothetical protein [Planctomycetaceae bacterium]
MEQENANGKIEGKPRKVALVMGLVLLCLLIYAVFIPMVSKRESGKLSILPIEGTIVIYDENGVVVPFQPTGVTVVSDFISDFPGSDSLRTRFFEIDESWKLDSSKPTIAATLFFNTNGTVLDFLVRTPIDTACSLW